MPFNTSDPLIHYKKVRAGPPGPGSYVDVNNPLHCSLKGVIKNVSHSVEDNPKNGPFGANNDRFFNSWLKPKAGPSPGQYEKQRVHVLKAKKTRYDFAIEGQGTQESTRQMTAGEKMRAKPNANFASTSNRFQSTAHDTARSMGTASMEPA